MERLDFDLLFRWFVRLGIDGPVWDHSTFSKNRDRLIAGDVADEFLATQTRARLAMVAAPTAMLWSRGSASWSCGCRRTARGRLPTEVFAHHQRSERTRVATLDYSRLLEQLSAVLRGSVLKARWGSNELPGFPLIMEVRSEAPHTFCEISH
jgi:hypothetical protein